MHVKICYVVLESSILYNYQKDRFIALLFYFRFERRLATITPAAAPITALKNGKATEPIGFLLYFINALWKKLFLNTLQKNEAETIPLGYFPPELSN